MAYNYVSMAPYVAYECISDGAVLGAGVKGIGKSVDHTYSSYRTPEPRLGRSTVSKLLA